MVHQTISSSSSKAPRASNKSQSIRYVLSVGCALSLVGVLASAAEPLVPIVDDQQPLPPPLVQARSRWVPVRWNELPGLGQDRLHEAWNAWLRSCERPGPAFAWVCRDVRRLSIAAEDEKFNWMVTTLQPYRIESLQGEATGLLTGYFEPIFDASRVRTPEFQVPLHQPPTRPPARQPWYTRQQIDTLDEARAALQGREIAFLSDPIDALIMQIQGSGRLRLSQSDGSSKTVRLAFAGSNDQPYRSVGSWLQQQGAIREVSWVSIKAWAQQNPQRVNEMLWSNPRTVFFREEPLSSSDFGLGPKGAQGVPLTPGRSVAVDPSSIPYGTALWLVSNGEAAALNRLVLAQDTGNAITGATRVDYFSGWGPEAATLAGRLKQPVRLWALWPR